MPLLEWNEGFRTGDPSRDFEHRTLIRRINELCARQDDRGSGGDSSLFNDLHAEFSAHFALEEELMDGCCCGQCSAHRKDHQTLLTTIRDMTGDPAPDSLQQRLSRRLASWLIEHFRTMDAKLDGEAGHPLPS